MNYKKHPELTKSDVIERMPKACGDETAAVEFFERQRWGSSPTCPQCQSANVYRMTGRNGRRNKRYLWRCRACAQQYTVRTGAIYEKFKIAFAASGVWLLARVRQQEGRERAGD